MKTISSILFVFLCLVGHAQNDTLQADTLETVLNYERYMQIVKDHHPVAMQASLLTESGEANLRSSRGGFDPVLYGDYNNKEFKGTEYYELFESGLKIPTWFGIEFDVGYTQNSGAFLNPQNVNSGAGLWYGGISVPIGQGLFIDERRAALRQAQVFVEIAEQERRKALNKLVYDAAVTYWDWFKAYNALGVYRDAQDAARVRLDAVIESFEAGDRPAIDTLEAGIQWQTRVVSYQQAELDYLNAKQRLEVYLWAEGTIPLEIDTATVPYSIQSDLPDLDASIEMMTLDSMVANHPELLALQSKMEQKDIERRWKAEQLKPDLNLKYQPLIEPSSDQEFFDGYSPNNYTVGVEFKMPLFLRKERGELQLTKLSLNEMDLEIQLKQANLRYLSGNAINTYNTTQQQLNVFTQTVADYFSLLEGERALFNAGESSLFLVNAREIGYIQAEIKRIEILSSLQKSIVAIEYNFGLLWD